ncbi:hypothetical protein FB45DRAFT_5696 [Roridomyces roridus]|uniref:F-box domain-containing protein n=1 Tax=Roridomyces roridus TaxID=1738132 RepID=A0AAD7FY46_9AGAR|nr:hypothetical protein FB45DRAFT_5696 [Roridomyces roridus]
MTTEAIEAEIAQISLEIKRQKDVLRKLESSKSLLQRQLNASRDPIARLPVELSSDIFLQCLPSNRGRREYHQARAHLAPLLLLNICHHWTNIALSTPALWASIGIVFPRGRGFKDLLETWLRRAGSYHLRISIGGVFDSLVARPILHHSAQLERLVISVDEANIDDEDELFDLLGDVQLQMELPGLQALEIFGQGGAEPECFWISFHRLLRLSPNLTELTMQNISFMGNINEEEPDTLVLPHLRHLTHLKNFDDIDWISAPRLETLHMETESLFSSSLISFLRCSSPPLWKLQLFGDSSSWFDSFEDSMALIPTLTHLELACLNSALVEELFNFLWQNPHHVPDLQTLDLDEVMICESTSPTTVLTALADVLSLRRTRLKRVRFVIYPSGMPLPDDLTIFRELLADGMDIHIGLYHGPNILSSSES